MNMPSYPRPPGFPGRLAVPVLLAAVACSLSVARADVIVEADVTPLGGSFRYDITITNNESDDLAVVSFADAPGGDPLIDPTLVVPIGFVGSYDNVLGFVDFLADTASFVPGGTFHGFHFESLSGPGQFFSRFEALTVNGASVDGQVNTTVVPEAGTVGAAVVLAGLAAGGAWRRYRHTGTAV